MSFYKCRERCTAIKICWPLGYFSVLRPMASRIRGSLKTLVFCVGAVGAAVGATVICVGAVGAGGKGYVEYLHLSGPYGPYAKNSGPYSGPYGPYAKTKRFEATSDARGHRPEHTEISE